MTSDFFPHLVVSLQCFLRPDASQFPITFQIGIHIQAIKLPTFHAVIHLCLSKHVSFPEEAFSFLFLPEKIMRHYIS